MLRCANVDPADMHCHLRWACLCAVVCDLRSCVTCGHVWLAVECRLRSGVTVADVYWLIQSFILGYSFDLLWRNYRTIVSIIYEQTLLLIFLVYVWLLSLAYYIPQLCIGCLQSHCVCRIVSSSDFQESLHANMPCFLGLLANVAKSAKPLY